MLRVSDLRMRDVVNIVDGRRLGMIKDIDLDLEEGRIKAIILPGTGRFMGFLSKNDDIIIPWEKIRKLGVDVILVEIPNYTDPKHNF
ncbi:MAG TPA: YlmC/YmxH family sporulation protein [Clostridia bacterium]|nr:YlmC/YmxH family sporulation protein [Clostridia bacterium]